MEINRTLKQNIPLVLGLILVASCYFYNIGKPVLWGDEADTGVFSHNILLYGYPFSFDGRNLTFYEGGIVHSKKLINALVSWFPFYVGALSLKIFGESAAGLRALFVFFGALTFIPFYKIIKKKYENPFLYSTILLLSPQVFLFQRNARYYPILIFLYVSLLYYLTTQFNSRKKDFVFGSVCFVLLFHTHQLAALTCSITLFLYYALNKSIKENSYKLYPCVLGMLTWAVWFVAQGEKFKGQPLNLDFLLTDFHGWLCAFYEAIKFSIIDLDFINTLPLVLIEILLITGLRKYGKKYFTLIINDQISSFVLLNICVHLVVTASTFGLETNENLSILRYMPHLILCGYLPLLRAGSLLFNSEKYFAYFVILAISLNFFTLSFWIQPRTVQSPISWWSKVSNELINPPEDSWENILTLLQNNRKESNKNEVIAVYPMYLNELFIFYLGKDYLILPPVSQGSPEEEIITAVIGKKSMAALQKSPLWVISFLPFDELLSEYSMETIPYYRKNPDATRPELTRHIFYESENIQDVYVYHRRAQPLSSRTEPLTPNVLAMSDD